MTKRKVNRLRMWKFTMLAMLCAISCAADDDAPITESSTGLCGRLDEPHSCTGTGEDHQAKIRWSGNVDCDDKLRVFEACGLIRGDVLDCLDAIDSCEMCDSPVSGNETAPCLVTQDDDRCTRLMRCESTGSAE